MVMRENCILIARNPAVAGIGDAGVPKAYAR
jgi:hypothetical protein